jgi:hypothetical protein
VIEAGRTILVDREELFGFADRSAITIASCHDRVGEAMLPDTRSDAA